MSIKYKNFSVERIILDGDGTTQGTLHELKKLILDGTIVPEEYSVAKLRYNSFTGLGRKETEEYYPLKFYGKEKEIWLGSVTSGYRGEGPRGTLSALKLMKFSVGMSVKEAVLNKKITNEVFRKNRV